jgi:hypothetical protein
LELRAIELALWSQEAIEQALLSQEAIEETENI